MTKSFGHYTSRKHKSSLSMRKSKPQLEKGWRPPEVISKTLSLDYVYTLFISFLYVSGYSPPFLLVQPLSHVL